MSYDLDAMTHAVLEMWNSGNTAAARQVYSPDAKRTAPNQPEPLYGVEAILEYVEQTRAAFPDLRLTFDDVLAGNNGYVIKWTFEGTQQGVYNGMAPSNRRVRVNGVTWVRVRDGKAVSEDVYFDNMAVAIALGALPAMGASA